MLLEEPKTWGEDNVEKTSAYYLTESYKLEIKVMYLDYWLQQ